MLNIIAPPNKQYLPFQIEGIKWITSRKSSMIGDEMGLGKTIQAIGAINTMDARKVLIICPAGVKLNWDKELNEWLIEPLNVYVVMGKTFKIPADANVVIVNYDLVAHSFIWQQLVAHDWALLVCDEAHYLKNQSAKRTKAVLARNGIVHKAAYNVMLTGTPILNRPIELYPVLKVCAPQVLGKYINYISYAYRYCAGHKAGFRFDVSGASNTRELGERLRATYMLRRTVDEVQKDLPDKVYQVHLLDSSTDMQGKLTKIMDPGRLDFKYMDSLDGEHIATIRRETAMEKVKHALPHLRDTIESCDKVVIFAYHREVVAFLEENLTGYGVARITGGDSIEDRQAAIERFRTKRDCRVFIGQIQAAGQGINGLQENCHHVVFVEWSWVPGEIEQAIKRVHRMGQTKTVHVQFLVWAKSVEEHMMRTALDKLKTIREIVDQQLPPEQKKITKITTAQITKYTMTPDLKKSIIEKPRWNPKMSF